MKVKKYMGPSMRDAMEKMKKDLGTGAVILGSRKISRGGILDFLGKEMFEVTATTEENILSGRKSTAMAGTSAGSRVSVTVGDDGPVAQSSKAEFPGLVKGTLAGVKPLPTSSFSSTPAESNSSERGKVLLLQQELKDLRSAVGDMAEQIKYQRMPSLPPVLKDIYKKLVDIELEEKIAGDLIQRIFARFSQNEYSRPEKVEKCLIEEISRMIKVARPTPVRDNSPLVIALTGPSGTGKTTSLAKLATNKKFYGGKKIAMVTADTYRVAATQQLGTFSEIADIPMEIVHSPRDIAKVLKRHRDKEVILVDTAGSSQFNEKMLSELKDLLQAADPDEVHLVLSVNTKPKDMAHAIKRFRTAKNMRLLLTKFDETLTFGSIVSVAQNSEMPVSFLTFGQEVPEDIEAADPVKIANLVVNNVF
jgi:flagellar biosynthesis protein FlhF